MNFINFGNPSGLSELDDQIDELEEDDFPLVFQVGETKFTVESIQQMNSYYSAFRSMYKNLKEDEKLD